MIKPFTMTSANVVYIKCLDLLSPFLFKMNSWSLFSCLYSQWSAFDHPELLIAGMGTCMVSDIWQAHAQCMYWDWDSILVANKSCLKEHACTVVAISSSIPHTYARGYVSSVVITEGAKSRDLSNQDVTSSQTLASFKCNVHCFFTSRSKLC